MRLGFDFASFGRISKKVSVRLIQSVLLWEQLSQCHSAFKLLFLKEFQIDKSSLGLRRKFLFKENNVSAEYKAVYYRGQMKKTMPSEAD